MFGQSGSFGRGEQEALAAIAVAFLLLDVAGLDQRLENPRQALLGDLQDIQEHGDRHAGAAIDEMQNAVVRAAEAEIGQNGVRLADKVAVGEEQLLDNLHRWRRPIVAWSAFLGDGAMRFGGRQ